MCSAARAASWAVRCRWRSPKTSAARDPGAPDCASRIRRADSLRSRARSSAVSSRGLKLPERGAETSTECSSDELDRDCRRFALARAAALTTAARETVASESERNVAAGLTLRGSLDVAAEATT
jgi:hypothetical protein